MRRETTPTASRTVAAAVSPALSRYSWCRITRMPVTTRTVVELAEFYSMIILHCLTKLALNFAYQGGI